MKLGKIGMSALVLLSLAAPAAVGMATTTTVNASDQDVLTSTSDDGTGIVMHIYGIVHVSDVVTHKAFVPMVSFNEDGTTSPVTNRALLNDTPWQSDIQRIANDTRYFRVSTNEWVSSAYVTNYEYISG